MADDMWRGDDVERYDDGPQPGAFREAARRFEDPPGPGGELRDRGEPGEGRPAEPPGAAGPADTRGGPGRISGAGRPPRRPASRPASAGAVLAAMLLGFFLAGLLSAEAIEKRVAGQPLGAGRTVALALLKPMVFLSNGLRLDRPAEGLDAALGREERHHELVDVKPAAKWPRDVTRAKPLRLYIIGDSMAQVFGSSLVNAARETGVVKTRLDYKVSSGLSRPDFYDWPQHIVDVLVEFDPDATVVLFGANDGQSVDYGGKVLKVGSDAWRRLYQRRVGRAMTLLTRGRRRVYWVGNPIMRDPGYRARIAMMNAIYKAEAPRHPGVVYVDTWALMARRDGSFAEYLAGEGGDLVLMRGDDGIHLTRAGGDRVARHVLSVVARDWGMRAPR